MIIPAQVSLSNLFECDNKVIKSNCFQFRKSSKIVNYTKLKCQKQMLSYLKCLECRNFNAFLEPTVNELWLLFYFYSMFVVSTCVITTAICFHVLSLLCIHKTSTILKQLLLYCVIIWQVHLTPSTPLCYVFMWTCILWKWVVDLIALTTIFKFLSFWSHLKL